MENKEEYYKQREIDIQGDTGIKVLNAISEEVRGNNILEIGCGTGILMQQLKTILDVNITGIDGDDYAISLAKKHGLNVIKMDVEDMSEIKDNTFDCIIGQKILEHVNIHTTIKECIRIGKKCIFLIEDNIINKELRSKLPKHRLIKDVVKYVYGGEIYRNHLIIFESDKKDIKKKKQGE